jgi:anti-sigma B factor antagonist
MQGYPLCDPGKPVDRPTLDFVPAGSASRVNTTLDPPRGGQPFGSWRYSVQTPANSETGPNGPEDVEAGPVRALNEIPPVGQQLQISADERDGVVVLHVAGEVDLLTANTLGERIRDHLGSANQVVLDLTEVSFLGSAGLAEIVSSSQAGAESGARIMLVATNRAVLRPMEVTGLLSLFPVYQSVDAALANTGS